MNAFTAYFFTMIFTIEAVHVAVVMLFT